VGQQCQADREPADDAERQPQRDLAEPDAACVVQLAQLRPRLTGAPDPLLDLARIGVDVAHGRIDLREPNPDLGC